MSDAHVLHPPAHRAGRAWLGPLLCAAAMITVGTSVVASKLIGVAIEPFLATALRHALALPVLGVLCLVRRPAWPRPGARDALILVAQAAAGSVGYTVLLIAGASMASAADAGIVAGTLPAMATVFAVLGLGERPRARAVAGIVLATVGVLMLASAPGEPPRAEAGHRTLGILLVAAAVACEVVFILGQKRLRVAIEPLPMATLMSAGGLLLSLPAAWAIGSLHGAPSLLGSAAALPAVAAVAWYAWVPTVLGFWLWYAGARRATATQAAAATAWLPVMAVFGAAAVLGESIAPTQWLALGLVVLGVLWGSR